jgi:hypothetical protein
MEAGKFTADAAWDFITGTFLVCAKRELPVNKSKKLITILIIF